MSEDYQQNASAIFATRQYSPFAHWKFREFNEYPHLLNKRLKLSHEAGMHYVNQFPKQTYIIIARLLELI